MPTRGSGWITLHRVVFQSARTNLLHTRRQNSAVVSPAKYTVNNLDESNKNFNALGKAPHCIVLSFSLYLVLHNQYMGPEQCKLFLNIQTANRDCSLKKEGKEMQTSKWMELLHPSSLTSKAHLTDQHEKEMCQSCLLLAESPSVAVPTSFLHHSAGLVMQQKQVTALLSLTLPAL